MSVRTDPRVTSPETGRDSIASPKKRKHTSEEHETKKKKKKQRVELETSTGASTQEYPMAAEKTKKKKKKDKREAQEEALPEVDAPASQEEQDIEVVDAPASPEPLSGKPDALHTNGSEQPEAEAEQDETLLESEDPTSFYSTRLSLYVSIPAVSLESGLSGVLATHLAPLLLTYFPPAKGIVLAFADPVLSAKPGGAVNLNLVAPSGGQIEPSGEVLARTADEFGVCWVWLTATFLVFRPEKGDELRGWTNVTSEGLVGLVSYNYFQTAVGKSRIPESWRWNGPADEVMGKSKKKGKKGRLRDEGDDGNGATNGLDEAEDDGARDEARDEDEAGFFTDENGDKVTGTLVFRVVDTEVVAGHERDKWQLQIDGSLLDQEAEQRALDEEKAKFEQAQQRAHSSTTGGGDAMMSGGLGLAREGSVSSRLSGRTPERRRVAH